MSSGLFWNCAAFRKHDINTRFICNISVHSKTMRTGFTFFNIKNIKKPRKSIKILQFRNSSITVYIIISASLSEKVPSKCLIQTILRMRKASSGHMLSIETFYSIRWYMFGRTVKALIRLRGCAGWSRSLLSAYDWRHIFAWSSSFNPCGNAVCIVLIHFNSISCILIILNLGIIFSS